MSEVKKQRKHVKHLWELSCIFDAALDGVTFAAGQLEEAADDLKPESREWKEIQEAAKALKIIADGLGGRESAYTQAHEAALRKLNVLENQEKVEGLRKAEPGLYIRPKEGLSISAHAIYRYGGADVWMENSKVIDTADVPWPLVKLEPVPSE